MVKKKVFLSFDFDHDEELKNYLVGQSKSPGTPFELSEWSVDEPMTGDWKENVKKRIKGCQVLIVVCGEHTHAAAGVSEELEIAQEEKIPYFLLWGRDRKTCTKPKSAKETDQIYSWSWENLKALIGGTR